MIELALLLIVNKQNFNSKIMKAIVIFLFLALPSLSFSQMVNNIPLKDIDAEYIQFFAIGKAFDGKGSKIYLYLDYGQARIGGFSGRPEELTVKDDFGKEMLFNSDIDCLNFMYKYGYELVSKNERITEASSLSIFLLKKMRPEKKK